MRRIRTSLLQMLRSIAVGEGGSWYVVFRRPGVLCILEHQETYDVATLRPSATHVIGTIDVVSAVALWLGSG